jgi:hypothetical protein
MSSSNRRDGEIRELLTIIGETAMQSQLKKKLKDVAIYGKDAEELCLGGFCRYKKHVVSKLKNIGVFAPTS